MTETQRGIVLEKNRTRWRIYAPVGAHRDLLAYLVRRLRPWHGNLGKRLTRTPKLYWRDTGLLHAIQPQQDGFQGRCEVARQRPASGASSCTCS